ncbi:MAG: long-chain fatty acid--CoA ligase [Austwickia sp.]|nr:MAG: long-chain fatty acid--CoA ligase [Austwickia sp.]
MTNLAQNLVESARRHPDRLALIQDEQRYTFAQFEHLTQIFAGHLRDKGFVPGDRLALSLPNITAFPLAYYAALRLGCVVVPMNPLFKPREVEYYLRDAGAKLLIGLPNPDTAAGAEAAGVEYLEVTQVPALLGTPIEPVTEVVDRDDDDTAVLLYTSGTTGSPKGAELRHRNLNSNQEVAARTLLEVTDADTLMGCLPLFHVFGMTAAMNICVATGACLTLLPRFEPVAALKIIERDKATVFLGVPTMYGALLAAQPQVQADVSSLRVCISGGASLPVELMRKFEAAFDCIILEGYGLSETSPVASFNHPHSERKPGSIGTPIEGVEMDLHSDDGSKTPEGEIGEIVIRGDCLMRGYWNKPDATAAAIRDGWFYTGDLATRDAEGYYSIVDRSKDMIIRGGYNVYPREVEEVLYTHPAVLEVAVVGVPDERLGEEVAAYVVLNEGASATAEELTEYAKERLAAYKYPRAIHVIEALPKGATGKILKRELPRPAVGG